MRPELTQVRIALRGLWADPSPVPRERKQYRRAARCRGPRAFGGCIRRVSGFGLQPAVFLLSPNKGDRIKSYTRERIGAAQRDLWMSASSDAGITMNPQTTIQSLAVGRILVKGWSETADDGLS